MDARIFPSTRKSRQLVKTRLDESPCERLKLIELKALRQCFGVPNARGLTSLRTFRPSLTIVSSSMAFTGSASTPAMNFPSETIRALKATRSGGLSLVCGAFGYPLARMVNTGMDGEFAGGAVLVFPINRQFFMLNSENPRTGGAADLKGVRFRDEDF
jgi:hypothetical protein